MHHLLEIVVDNLDEGPLLDVHLDNILEMLDVVVTIVLADEIVEIHQELGSSHSAHELGGDGIHEVDELAAERLEVSRGNGDATEVAQTVGKERIHRDGHTVRVTGSAALVVLVKDMALKILDVLVGEATPVQGLDLVLHDVAVLLDVVLLVKLLAKRHYVLAGHIGVGVELRSCGGVRGGDIVFDEVPLLTEVETSIEFLDVGYRHLLVDRHEALLDLPADLAAGDLVVDVEVLSDRNHYCLGALLAGRLVGLANAAHQFDLVVFLKRTIGLAYSYIHDIYIELIDFYRKSRLSG